MYRAQYLVQPEPVLHREHEFGEQVAGMLADNGGAEDFVAAGNGQDLDHAVRFFVGDGAVQIVDRVRRHFMRHAFFPRVLLVETDTRNFGFGEGCPRDHRVIDFEHPEPAEQRVDRGVPRHVGSGMRKLIRSGDVTARVNIGVGRLQVFVELDGVRAGRGYAELFETVAVGIGDPADRA